MRAEEGLPSSQTQPFTSFKGLGGFSVAQEEIEEEVARWPMDGLLGTLAGVSVDAVQKGQDFFDARHQGPYLNLAIVDDFPNALPGASSMYAPGRVPMTGGRHLFIHELNIARLAHIAILFGRDRCTTTEISYDLSRRVYRFLLILNDLSPGGDTPIETIRSSLSERRKFAFEWLRYHQFNHFFNSAYQTMAKLARQKVLLLQILPKFFQDTERAFLDATGGVNLQRYFEILAVILAHTYYQMSTGKHWISKQGFASQVKAGAGDIRLIMQRWTRTPEEYRAAFTEWSSARPLSGVPGFDFVPLRETPLIEARPGELVCPVLPFLLAKIEDDAYFILSNHLKDAQEFQAAVGRAYQEYASRLVERISRNDSAGIWNHQASPVVRENVELADDYLQRGSIGVCFEHKAGRPGTDFLRGGEGARLLGPSDDILSKLDQQRPVSCREGRDNDRAVLTRGMWQQSLHGPELVRWAEGYAGNSPATVWPIITHLCNIRVDETVYPLYIEPLVNAAPLYQDGFWQKPQWLHIEDLEALATLSEQGFLDLATLLSQKAAKYKHARFDVALYELFRGKKAIDAALMDEVQALLKEAGVTFWEEPSQGPEH